MSSNGEQNGGPGGRWTYAFTNPLPREEETRNRNDGAYHRAGYSEWRPDTPTPEERLGPSPEYIARMVEKGTIDIPRDLDSTKITATITPPKAPVFQSRQGMPRSGATASLDDLVLVDMGNGKTTGVEIPDALRMGLIRQVPGGGFEAVASSGQQGGQVQHRPQEPTVSLEALRETGDEPDADGVAAIDAVNAVIPAEKTVSLVEDFIRGGGFDEQMFSDFASSQGMDHGRAVGMAEAAVAGFQRQADRAVATQGIPVSEAQAVYDWAGTNHTEDFRNAQRALVLASDTRPLKALAAKYRLYRLQRG